ncbi:MAG: HNH endonuclease [Candidatus Dormibacteria bacterium]
MKRGRNAKRPRNDSQWRADCLELRGPWCRACGDSRDVQVHHILPRAHGGESVVENGQPMCGPWTLAGPAGGCHAQLTEHRMLNRREWLDDDQAIWLADRGWVWWDAKGEPNGRGFRSFAEAHGE